MHSRGAPQGIRGGHLANQCANVVWHRRTSDAMSALPGPEQAKPAAMPRDDRVRLDDVNRRVPAGPRVREPRPQDSIGRREAKTWAPRSMDDSQLVPERDDFQVQRGARLDDKSERVQQRHDDGRHDCRLSENARNLKRRNTYELLGSHRFEVDGQFVIGEGGFDLLNAVSTTGSLTGAAQTVGWSYRHAWGYLRRADAMRHFRCCSRPSTSRSRREEVGRVN